MIIIQSPLPTKGVIANIPVKSLGELTMGIGPDVRQVHGAFHSSNAETSYGAVWDHKSEEIQSINTQVNKWLEPKAGKIEEAVRLFNNGSGRLAERLWLITHKLAAIYTPVNVLSNMWWPVRLTRVRTKDGAVVTEEEHEKIQAIWLNSTIGLLGSLAWRQDTRGAWIKFKKDTMKNIPLLDLTKLTRQEVDDILVLYGKLANDPLHTLPTRLANGSDFDNIIKTILHIKDDLGPLELLKREPILTLTPLA